MVRAQRLWREGVRATDGLRAVVASTEPLHSPTLEVPERGALSQGALEGCAQSIKNQLTTIRGVVCGKRVKSS